MKPCVYRGGDTKRRIPCPSCPNPGQYLLSVYRCDVHGQCTILKESGRVGVHCCETCGDRREPEPEPFPSPPVRDLAYHIYPLRNNVWQWNVRQLLKRIHLFNGRRVVAVVLDERTDPLEDVMRMFGCEVDYSDYVVCRNDSNLREVKPLNAMLSMLRTDDPSRCLLYAHAKAVTRGLHGISRDWAEVLYETMMDYWPVVEQGLVDHPLTGSFRNHYAPWKETRAKWFYSGSWVWYRSHHLYSGNWKGCERFWTGIEPFPATLFPLGRAGLVFCDSPGNLYDQGVWDSKVWPEYHRWTVENRDRRTDP